VAEQIVAIRDRFVAAGRLACDCRGNEIEGDGYDNDGF